MIKKNSFKLSTLACALSAIFNAQAAEIETIEVTATKRVENLQEIPLSVSAISADELKNLKLRDTTEIASQIPNMQISTPGGDSYPVISIRGISMDDYSLNQSSSVAIYVDEVYKGNPALQSVQMFDLERIEVLRGPQGTLFGKNTTGGLVNFITKRPSGETGGYVTVGLGDNNRKEFKGAFETSLTDDLNVRVAGTATEMDGWKKNKLAGGNDSNGIDEWGARISLNYTPSDDIDVLLKLSASNVNPYNYGYTNTQTEIGYGAGAYELFNNSVIGLPAMLGVTPPANAPQESYFSPEGLEYDEFEEEGVVKREIENTAVSLNINWDVSDNYSITSITSYDEGDMYVEEGDGTPLKVHSAVLTSDIEQFTQDLRLSSNFDGAFNFIVGAFYASEDNHAPTDLNLFQDVDFNVDGNLDYLDCLEPLMTAFGMGQATPNGVQTEAALNSFGYSLANFAGLGCQLKNDYTQEKTSIAAYADGSYDLSEQTTLRFGLRATNDKTELKDFTASYSGSDGIELFETINQAWIPETEIDDTEWSGKFSVDHTLTSGQMIYASYNRGYRSGAFNGQAFNDPSELVPVPAETVDAYEFGFKAEFLARQIRLNGAAFYYDYKNQQLLDVDAETAAQTLQTIDKSTIQGLELELTAALTDDLTLRSGFGYLDTEAGDGVFQGVEVSGNSLTQSPKYNVNVSLDYYQSLGDSGSLQWHWDANWVDEQYFNIQNTDAANQDAYALTNARVTWNSPEDTYQVAIWGKNLTDEEYATRILDLADFGGSISHIGQPLNFGVELTANF